MPPALLFLFLTLTPPVFAWTGKCVAVTDGDTIKVLNADKREIKIRLANIDAPEKKQAFGMKAKQAMSEFAYGKTVEVRTQTIDRYGRTVAVVLVDGVDVSAVMVTKGLAWVYVKYNQDPSLPALEAEARSSRRGLWADDNPIPPWAWRHGQKALSKTHANRWTGHLQITQTGNLAFLSN